jgi:hypothetical protein
MVIEDGQRMAAASIGERHPALEVHLPEQIGGGLLKALVSCRTAGRGNDTTVATQDLVHRRIGGTCHAITFEAAHDLARSPGRMSIAYR